VGYKLHVGLIFLSPAKGQEVKIHKDDDDSLLLTFNCSSCLLTFKGEVFIFSVFKNSYLRDTYNYK